MIGEVGHDFDDTRKTQFLQWLLLPKSERNPPTQAGIAAQIGVSARTLRDWLQNEQFRAAWKKQQSMMAASPEKVRDVLDALYTKACDPKARDQVTAAKTWLSAVGADASALQAEQKPQAAQLSALSVEQLLEIAAYKAKTDLAARKGGLPEGKVIDVAST